MAKTNSLKYYELVRKHYMLCSDYKLAQHLGVARQTIMKWKQGGAIGEENALLIADRLGLDPLLVVSECLQDSAPTRVSQMYYTKLIDLIKKGGTPVGAVLFACFVLLEQASTVI